MPVLPYATVKPHDADECRACSRQGAGHHTCVNSACPGRSENDGAGRVATHHTLRHATDKEYAALPLGLIPIDGIAHQLVPACDYCYEDVPLFCDHPEPEPGGCPTCGVEGDIARVPCLRRDGKTPLHFIHSDRPRVEYQVCRHAHRADCDIFVSCACTGDDPDPIRPPHPARAVIDGPGPDVSRVLEPNTTIPLAQALLLRQGVHWWQVRELASCLTQDNQPALRAEIAQLDGTGHFRHDDHGHEIIRTVVIPIEAAARGQWQMPAPDDAEPVE